MELRTSLLIESWTLYVLGVTIVALRMLSRRILLGKWRNLTIDDYLMLFALANFTVVATSVNDVAKNGNNYMSPEIAASLTPDGIQRAIHGSIMTFVLELFTITGTWTIKACLLILYARLTRHTLMRQHMLVKIATAYCIVTYILIIFLFVFYWCSPTYEYWSVPANISQCATYYHHIIFTTACNISSDILLLVIPIPIIVKAGLAAKTKAFLVCILCPGILNILITILNRYYSFSIPNSYVFLYWYAAEVGIAMLVGNIPLCWPLLRAVFGVNDTTYTVFYDRRTTRRGSGRRNKKTMIVLGSEMLHPVEYQEEAVSGVPEHPPLSDQGSHVGLALQEQRKNDNSYTASSANSLNSGTVIECASST